MKRGYNTIALIISIIALITAFGCSETRTFDSDSNNSDSNLTVIDPLYNDQWHLNNTGQGGGTPGMDINVTPVWDKGIYGKGVIIALVDDGLDYEHEDLSNNVLFNYNYDYTIPKSASMTVGPHGTSVAGVSAAVHNNYYGGRGAAPEANIIAYNLLAYGSTTSTTSNIADAMTRNKDIVDISNNSWGPTDCTGQIEDSSSAWKLSIDDGITNGRDGKGIIYVWAAGNGGYCSSSGVFDNSNYDGYANYYGVIAVGALGDNGARAYYSERGSNLWVTTYSSGGSSGITTTDITGLSGWDESNYTDTFGGTSSAAPLAAGAIALILEKNPALTWRDVKLILAESAAKIDPEDTGWTVNGAGYSINYKYGFGSIDADAAVTLAETWTNVGTFITEYVPAAGEQAVNTAIPDNNTTGINDIITVSGSTIAKIEYVEIAININHPSAGELEITLTSPGGTESILTEQHNCADTYGITNCSYFDGGSTFNFGTVRSLGESANGNWTLTFKDLSAGNPGTLTGWRLRFFGRQ